MIIKSTQYDLTCMSFESWKVAPASTSRAARMYASAELKELNASSVKLGSHIAALRHRWFMALSTSELVTDTLSESSERGQSAIAPALALALEVGSGVGLLDICPATPPDTVRRMLFLKYGAVRNATFRYDYHGAY